MDSWETTVHSFPEAHLSSDIRLHSVAGLHLEELCGLHKCRSHTVGHVSTEKPFTVDLKAARADFGLAGSRLSRFPDDTESEHRHLKPHVSLK